MNYMEQPDIEKEVKRLFRMDAEAIDVKWEVIMEDDKPLNDSTGQPQTVVEASGSTCDDGPLHRTDTSTTLDLLDQDMILPELSSSEDEEDKDVNIMDSGEDDTNITSQDLPDSSRPAFTLSDQGASQSQDYMLSGDTGTLKARLSELQQQIEELRERRQVQEDQAATADNQLDMDHFQAAIDNILEEENEKEKEYNILLSMLGSG